MNLIWTLLQSDIAQMILVAVAALGGIWGWGKAKERKGKLEERKQAEIDGLRADAKAEKLRDEIDNSLGSDPRSKLRSKWLRR